MSYLVAHKPMQVMRELEKNLGTENTKKINKQSKSKP